MFSAKYYVFIVCQAVRSSFCIFMVFDPVLFLVVLFLLLVQPVLTIPVFHVLDLFSYLLLIKPLPALASILILIT